MKKYCVHCLCITRTLYVYGLYTRTSGFSRCIILWNQLFVITSVLLRGAVQATTVLVQYPLYVCTYWYSLCWERSANFLSSVCRFGLSQMTGRFCSGQSPGRQLGDSPATSLTRYYLLRPQI